MAKAKWGKLGSPKSAKRKKYLASIRPKAKKKTTKRKRKSGRKRKS